MSYVRDGFVYIGSDDVTYPFSSASTSSAGVCNWGDTYRQVTPRTITASNDAGLPGEICWDADYIYICVANDTWKRGALSTW